MPDSEPQLYDSTNADNLPTESGAMYAGYIDGNYRSYDSIKKRFPSSTVVPIAVFATTNDGEVLDVENGDATPIEAPGWVKERRAAGVNPVIYCNADTWPAVQQAFDQQSVEQPLYWIADWDGNPTIPSGAVAKQYMNDIKPGYDVSSVSSIWPKQTEPTPAPPQPEPQPQPQPSQGVFDVSSLSLLKSGSVGNQVKSCQLLLNGKHNSSLVVDGIFGSHTLDAVVSYQSSHKLAADGIVGPDTWGMLLENA